MSECVCSLNRKVIGCIEAFRVPTVEGKGSSDWEVALHMQSMSELTCVVGLPSRTCSFFQLEAHTSMAVTKATEYVARCSYASSQPLPFDVVIVTIIIIIITFILVYFHIHFSFSFFVLMDPVRMRESLEGYRRKIWYQKSNGSLRGKPKLVRLTLHRT